MALELQEALVQQEELVLLEAQAPQEEQVQQEALELQVAQVAQEGQVLLVEREPQVWLLNICMMKYRHV